MTDDLTPEGWAKFYADTYKESGWPLMESEIKMIRAALMAIAEIQSRLFHGNETEYLEPCCKFLEALLEQSPYDAEFASEIKRIAEAIETTGVQVGYPPEMASWLASFTD